MALSSIVILDIILPEFLKINGTWERAEGFYLKVCYSIVASTIFFYFNQHLPKMDKKISSYYFEVSNINRIVAELKDILVRITEVGKDGVDPEQLYSDCCSLYPEKPPLALDSDDRTFISWVAFLEYKSYILKGIVRDLLPLHESINPLILECLLGIENVCNEIKEVKQNPAEPDPLYIYLDSFRLLNRYMVELKKYSITKYADVASINNYRNLVNEVKLIFPAAYAYKTRRPDVTFNRGFLKRAVIVFVLTFYILQYMFIKSRSA
jgi:hypothetical protein